MKIKIFLFVVLAMVGIAGATWIYSHLQPSQTAASADGRKILYYTCSMHPWVREKKPGPCPVCGMNLTPVYENEEGKVNSTTGTNSVAEAGTVTLEAENISVINVQTDLVERRPIHHTLHFAGEITGNSATAAWFEFIAYERDLQWLKVGQTIQVVVPSAPEKIFPAQIERRGAKPFADADFDMMTGSTKVRAEISNPPVQPGDFGKNKIFNNLHAEAHVVAETENVLSVPRSAVISRGFGAMVYVDKGGGHYAPREISLGRIGDKFAEVTDGLNEGERVVTTGNVLIDSEAQLTSGK